MDAPHDPETVGPTRAADGDTTAGLGPRATTASARYRVGRELARGGMGSIHEAQDEHLSRTVAVKQLLVEGAHARARFEREALLTARLQHPAVVPVYDFGEFSPLHPFFAMKLVEGQTLRRAIDAAGTLEARLALLPHMLTVVEAVAYAHSRGIVHRDLKPHNVLVGAFGETVVIDWGLAKESGAADETLPPDTSPGHESLTQLGAVMGTPAYMAPEQAVGLSVDARADVYALGAMLYHLLAGHHPYPDVGAAGVLAEVRARPPVSLQRAAPGLPADLVTIVEKAMARDRGTRYANAGEMATDLRRFQTGQLVGAHRYTAWQLLRRLVGKNPLAAALGAVVTIALLSAFTVFVVQQARVRDLREVKRVADVEISALESAIESSRDAAALRHLTQQLEDATRLARRAADDLASAGVQVPRTGDDLDRGIHDVLARLDADTYSIPAGFRNEVGHALDTFRRGRALDALRQRKRDVWPVVVLELDALGLPRELGYLAWVESWLDQSAVGLAGAKGLWQLSPDMAQRYGLRVDGVVDERTDPAKSSRAAAQHLADLIAWFGDDAALLAVVSYNLGDGKTRAFLHEIAMEKGSWRSGRRSYWYLMRTRRLPAEASNYVARLVAVALLDRSLP